MAEKKKSKYKLEDINLDIDKLHTLSRLKEEGYDTSNKIKTINMDDVVKHDLSDELRNIVDMQKAIKANHFEIGWLLDGEDPKPERKEDKPDADERRYEDNGSGAYSN